jgi:hypothetical protein
VNRPWFGRRWVIQEVTLAKKAVVVSSEDSMDFDQFLDIMLRFAVTIEQKDERLEALTMIRDLRAFFKIATTTSWQQQRLRPLRMLESFRHTNCADSRDRIYALKEIASTALGEDVSYLSPVEMTYISFAAGLIRDFESPSIWNSF